MTTPTPVAVFNTLWKTGAVLALLVALATVSPLSARDKDGIQYGMGLIVNVPFPENEVAQVVEDVSQNGIIRGTKEYAKDEYVSGATAETSVRVFPAWTEGGKVFYKVRRRAIDPRNFKDGGDVGTLAVRYVVQQQGDKNTVLRIDAVFVEDFRKASHPSNGSVEGAEYKDIHDRLEQIGVMKEQTAEVEREKQAQVERKFSLGENGASGSSSSSTSTLENPTTTRPDPSLSAGSVETPSTPASTAPVQSLPVQSLEDRVKDLRHQVERLVKAPGAPLKSAPFHTASTLQSLPSGTEVLIVIATPYWVGVETRDGQHGWMLRDDLELLP